MKTRYARISTSGKPLDPVQILAELAESCDRRNDPGFWILVSAAAYLAKGPDGYTSTAEVLFWSKQP